MCSLYAQALQRTLILISVLFLLVMATPASLHAVDLAVTERVGSVNLSLPLPQGYMEPSSLVPKIRQIGDSMTFPPNRLLAMFVSDEDIKLSIADKEPEMARYFMVQTLRKSEADVITPKDLSKVRDLLQGQYREFLKRVEHDAQGHLNSSARSIENYTGIKDISFRVGELQVVEIFDDRSTSISLLSLTKTTARIAEKDEEIPMVMGLTIAIIKGKLIYFSAYSRHRSSADLEWVRSQTMTWLHQVSNIN